MHSESLPGCSLANRRWCTAEYGGRRLDAFRSRSSVVMYLSGMISRQVSLIQVVGWEYKESPPVGATGGSGWGNSSDNRGVSRAGAPSGASSSSLRYCAFLEREGVARRSNPGGGRSSPALSACRGWGTRGWRTGGSVMGRAFVSTIPHALLRIVRIATGAAEAAAGRFHVGGSDAADHGRDGVRGTHCPERLRGLPTRGVGDAHRCGVGR